LALRAILTMRVDGKAGRKHLRPRGVCRRSNGATAFFFSMLMFSLAGVPPLGGFFAKYYVLLPAVQAGLYPLAVLGVLASAGGRLLLSSDRQGHVFSTSRLRFSIIPPSRRAPCWRFRQSSCCASGSIRRR